MINKELLEQIESLNEELKDLKIRLNNIDKQSKAVLTDSVQGSSREYPYTKHNFTVQGVKMFKTKHSRSTYKKMIKSSEYKLEKLINQLEYELKYIEDKDSEIRRIIRYKYEDNLSWIQVMFKMKYKSENTARMKLERFLEKF